MHKKANHSFNAETLEELNRISEIVQVNKSKVLDEILKKGLKEIRDLNYNFSEFIRGN